MLLVLYQFDCCYFSNASVSNCLCLCICAALLLRCLASRKTVNLHLTVQKRRQKLDNYEYELLVMNCIS